MILKDAAKLAVDICYKLQPFTERLNIAGSIRRQKPFVKDIEIVCVPKKVACGQVDIFESVEGEVVVNEFSEVINGLGKIHLGNPNGRQMKIELPQGIMVDLFMPQSHDYFRIYAIRTGSSIYSNLIIATAWKKKGWCGTDQGLRKIIDCLQRNDKTWKVVNPNGEKPPFWISEQDFFEWLGIKYIDPMFRDIASSSATEQKKTLKNLGL